MMALPECRIFDDHSSSPRHFYLDFYCNGYYTTMACITEACSLCCCGKMQSTTTIVMMMVAFVMCCMSEHFVAYLLWVVSSLSLNSPSVLWLPWRLHQKSFGFTRQLQEERFPSLLVMMSFYMVYVQSCFERLLEIECVFFCTLYKIYVHIKHILLYIVLDIQVFWGNKCIHKWPGWWRRWF